MKGISDVIAMLLMLVITIGLVGLAYSYISGIFMSRTGVVLNIDTQNSYCDSSKLVIAVRNDGTIASGQVNVEVKDPSSGDTKTTCSIQSVPAGSYSSCPTISRSSAGITSSGYYRIVASTSGASTSGIIYCP